jgi:uncharacterized membrane protein
MKQYKWFILVLVISLILNIFMGGVLLGKYLFHPPSLYHESGMMRPPHPRHLVWILKQLPEEMRQKVEPVIQAQFQQGKMRAEMRQTHRLFREIETLLLAEPLDKAAIKQQFQLLQDRKNNMATRLNESLLLIAEQLNQQERQQLIEALRYSRPFHDKPRHHRRHHEEFERED